MFSEFANAVERLSQVWNGESDEDLQTAGHRVVNTCHDVSEDDFNRVLADHGLTFELHPIV